MKKAHHPTKDLQMKAAPELKQKIESANQNLVQSLWCIILNKSKYTPIKLCMLILEEGGEDREAICWAMSLA